MRSDSEDEAWVPAIGRVTSRALARTAGFTDRMIDYRLSSGRWRRLLPGTYLTSDTLTWFDKQRAALLFAGPHSVLSAAAALDGLKLRGVARPETLLVLAPLNMRRESAGFVRVRPTHRLPRPALRLGPRCAGVARAVADTTLEWTRLDDVRALVADVVRRQLCTADELAAELAAGPRRGSAHLRVAVDEVGLGAWSAPEARAATVLRRARITGFTQNESVVLPGGQRFVADFLWRRLRAILEIDSVEHHTLGPDADATDERHIALETAGFTVIHRRPSYINRHPDRFAAGVGAWLAGRKRELGLAA